jgi:hypothetical protein
VQGSGGKAHAVVVFQIVPVLHRLFRVHY